MPSFLELRREERERDRERGEIRESLVVRENWALSESQKGHVK